MDEHKLTIGETYYITYLYNKFQGETCFIGKYLLDNKKSDDDHLRGIFNFIKFYKNSLYGTFDHNSCLCYCNLDGLRTYRIATYKEKRWLEYCIKINKFISEEEFIFIFRKEKINKLLI